VRVPVAVGANGVGAVDRRRETLAHRPRPVGEMPRGLRGMQEVVLDTHELTAEAIVKVDYGLLRRALMTDPLTNSIADADAILRELLAAERDALPDQWYIGGLSPAFVG